jgi:hypothetical protein
MASISVAEVMAAFTANGGADGYVTVADNAKFYPSALVWIWSDNVAAKQYVITDLVGTTKIGVRLVQNMPIYHRSDVSAYTLAQNSKISQEAQVVRVVQPTFSKVDSA